LIYYAGRNLQKWSKGSPLIALDVYTKSLCKQLSVPTMTVWFNGYGKFQILTPPISKVERVKRLGKQQIALPPNAALEYYQEDFDIFYPNCLCGNHAHHAKGFVFY